MKQKIVAILVCMLMLASISLAAGTIIKPSIQSEIQVATITKPAAGNLYLFDAIVIPIGGTTPIIIGPITLQATAQPNVAFAHWQVVDIQGNICSGDTAAVYPPNFQQSYSGRHFPFFHPPFFYPKCTITIKAYDSANNLLGSQSINAIKIL